MCSHRPWILCLALFAWTACDKSSGQPKEDADTAVGDERDAGPEHDDASASGRDAASADHDSGARSMDASTSAEDGGNASDAARDAAADAGRDASLDADILTIAPPEHTFVYVAGYSDDDGLRMFEIDRTSFALTPIAQDAAVGPQPSWLTPSVDGRTLYVANEDDSNAGITVLRLNEETHVPMRVDHEDAITSSFVFSSLAPDGKHLLAASYNGGNVAVYPVKPDGTLDPRVDARDFGAGAQAHAVRVHPSGKWAYVPTKGLDSVAQLKYDTATGKLTDNTPATFTAEPSASAFAGPRHIAFSRDGKLAFVILENGNALFSLSIQSDGTLLEADHKAREADNTGVAHTGAHVLAHPKANFVYGSNRVSNTLVAFSYDAQGKLTLIGRVPTRGDTPRDFDIDPLGKFLIVANQDGNSVAVFAIEESGALTAKGNVVTGLKSPAAVAIVAR
jgi:6-phosphogluconolactonase (cycloisomerase 2 family)